MEARINEARIAGLANVEQASASESLYHAQYALLNELPGVVFGFLTIAWIVTSLFNLM